MNGVYIDYTKLRAELSFSTVLNFYQIDFPADKNQVKVVCPFHEEATASCSINLDEKKFNCFGCGAKGNCLEFVVLHEGYDPKDKQGLQQGALVAMEIIGKDPSDFPKANKRAKPASKPLNKEKCPNPSQPLAEPENVDSGAPQKAKISEPLVNKPLDFELQLEHEHPFLTEREITPEVAEKFGLGFCKKGVMRNRIAIPIHNPNGEIVAYTGRWVDEELPEKEPRYKLPKNFHKSVELFNLHRVDDAHHHPVHLTIVEGVWSAIRLHQLDIKTVALLGTSCSEHQAKLIRESGFKFATVILDGDEGGRKATPEVVDVLSKYVYVRQIELPDGIKPDTMPDEYIDRLR